MTGPLAKKLTQWPTSGGSEFEKLMQVLDRIPENIKKLDNLVKEVQKSTG